MKRLLPLITILLFGLSSFAQDAVPVDSLKKDTIKKDSVKRIILKGPITYTPGKLITTTEIKTSDNKEKNIKTSNKEIGSVQQYSLTSSFPTGNDAGRTVGSLDVSASGAATYTIPIAVPPGINGVVPQVSLNYNSQGGNGVAGYGWNISGLSAITRIAKTRFHDGVVGGVNLDLNDRFALDGQRLIIKSGTYGADGAEYQTENYSNLKIVSKGSLGSGLGPAYFDVYYPDGSHAVYGQQTNSNSQNTYAIDYIDNPQSVRINYLYYKANGVISISEIQYGSPGTFGPSGRIQFQYNSRQRKEQGYVAGQEVYQSSILGKIVVISDGNNYRHYNLTHDVIQDLNYERLTSVQEVSGDQSKSFEPIIFSYNANSSSGNTIAINGYSLNIGGVSGDHSKAITADFTGNGKMDFILYPSYFKNSLSLGFDPGPGTQIYQQLVNYFEDIFPVSTLNHQNKLFSGKGVTLVHPLSTSSKRFSTYLPSSNSIGLEDYKDWDNVPLMPTLYSQCRPSVPGGAVPMEYFSGDFNGDGLTDVIAITQPYSYDAYEYNDPELGCTIEQGYVGTSTGYFINLDRRVTSNFVTQLSNLSIPLVGFDKIYTGDFNGNGKTDLLHIANGIMYVYELDANNILQLLWQQSDSQIQNAAPALLGDYNGDGKTDVMFPTTVLTATNTFAIFTSSGKTFEKDTKVYPFSYQTCGSTGTYACQYFLIPNDLNGDGKTDMLESTTFTEDNMTTGWGNVIIYNNLGSATASTAPDFQLSGTGMGAGLNLIHNPIPLFLTSTQEPNFSLEYALLSDHTMTLYQHKKDLRKETDIIKVSQDGIDLDIDYKVLKPGTTSGPLSLYQKLDNPNQIYPYVDIDIAPGLSMVSGLTRKYNNEGIPQELHQYFGYRGAVSNVDGLGFMGFNETFRTSWITGATDNNRIISTNVFDPQLRGAVIRNFTSKDPFVNNSTIKNKAGTPPDIVLSSAVTSAQTVIAAKSITLLPGFSANGANGTFIAKLDDPATGINDNASVNDYITRTDYTYKAELLTNKVYINIPIAVITKDLLNKTNTVETSTYDSYYNVKTQTSNLSGAGTKTVEYEYDNDPGNGYIGRLRKKKETATNGGDTFSTEEQYNAYSNFLPTEIKRKGNGTPFITENYIYDTYGNALSKQVVTTDGTRTTSKTYDASGRFVATVTDVEGLVTTMGHNTSTGNVTSKTNPYSQTTNYAYDVWGRPTTTTNYLSKSSTRVYNKDGSNIEIVETDDEGRSKTTITNAIGKTTTVTVKDVLGQDVEKNYKYDIYDRQEKESEPSIGGPTQWNITEYDVYSRPKKITSFTGKVADIGYDGLITTVDDGTKTTVTTKNALGNVISTQDPGGTINNTYFANGNLKSANYAGSAQTIEQDGWGRKTKLTDPSAGIYTYSYNLFGETLNESTPKGSTTYTYENTTGKLQRKVITGDYTNMTYDYYYRSDKLPDHTTVDYGSSNITTYTYSYDNDHRLIGSIENNEHAIFTKTITYDGYGRVDLETSQANNKSPNVTVSKTIKNIYQNGELLEIKDNSNGNSIWKVTALNARGQVTTALLGTALRETNVYNSFGYAQNFKTENITSTPVTLMELGFVFDQTRGNLTSRTNSVFSWSENFTYDDQDRLTGYNDNTGPHTQNYDNRGRITNNSQVGDYTYTGTSYQQAKVTNLTDFAKYHYQPSQNRHLQQIAYNAFKKPVSINEEGKERIDFQYNGDEQRSHMYYGNTDATKENRPFQRHYSEDGSMEITEDLVNGETSFVFYLGGDAYSAPAIWKHKHNSSTSTGALYYLHRDYLGSILLITDASGVVQEKRHFDAWGNVVKLEDGNGLALTEFKILDRGYTGHEHLFGVGLINMNGRLYDPILHRFLSPDNFIQDPTNTQFYNRFAYVINNPLKHYDISGEAFPLLVFVAAAIIGGGSNVVSNWSKIVKNPWSALGYFASGAAGGAVSVVNPLLGMAITSGGNVTTDVAFGNMPKFNNFWDIAKYTGGALLDGLGAAGAGGISKWGYNAATKFGWAKSYSITGLEHVSKGAVTTRELNIIYTKVPIKSLVKVAAGQVGKVGAAGEGLEYTQSSLKLGQEIHNAYKINLADKITKFKEFRDIPGIRPDFVDFSTKTIYELKPFNPRAMQQGLKQLTKYKSAFEETYGGTWKTVLDLY